MAVALMDDGRPAVKYQIWIKVLVRLLLNPRQCLLSFSCLVIQYYLLRTSLLIVLYTETTLMNESRFFVYVEEKQVSLIYITI